MKIKLLSLLLMLPCIFFAQRGPQSDNIFHNRDFWKTQPTVEIIKQKIAEGNDAVTPNKSAFDAVCFAIMAKAPLETIKHLLSLSGNDVNKPTHDGRSYLMWAGSAGDIDVMKLLLKKGADPKITGSHGFNWFTFTVNAGHEDTAIYDLIEANGIDLKETNRSGANAILLLAPHSKDGKILDYFQKKGVDINAKDDNGNNLLFYAVQRGNIALIKKYINKGFDYKGLNSKEENLVLFASQGGRGYSNSIEVYEYLNTLNLDFTLSNNKAQNALHFIARGTKDVKVIDYLIQKGVDTQQKDNEGNTPFLNAAKGNNFEVLQTLTPLVKDINQQNTEGQNALTFATHAINLKTFEFLTANGANATIVDADENNLYYHLFNAYSKRNSDEFKDYSNALKAANVSFTNASKNNSPLHIAIEKGENELISKALELGADINQKNKDGLTPLLLASMKATDTNILKMLISNGADKNATTDFEETVYDLAKENERLKNTDISFLK